MLNTEHNKMGMLLLSQNLQFNREGEMVDELGENLLAHHVRHWYPVSGLVILSPTTIFILFCFAMDPGSGERGGQLKIAGLRYPASSGHQLSRAQGKHRQRLESHRKEKSGCCFSIRLLVCLWFWQGLNSFTYHHSSYGANSLSRFQIVLGSSDIALSFRCHDGHVIQLPRVSCFTVHCECS